MKSKLDYEEFRQVIVFELQKRIPSLRVQSIETAGVNDDRKDRLVLLQEGMSCGPTVTVRNLYESYLKGSLEEVCEEVKDIFEQELSERVAADIVGKMRVYDEMKSRLFLALYNYEWNKEYLRDCVAFRWLDLTAAVRIDFKECGGTALVKGRLLEEWNVTEEDVYRAAIENMQKKKWRLQSIRDILCKTIGECPPQAGRELYVCTTEELCDAAAVMLVPGKMKECAEQLGVSTLVILPSSIHEVLLFPCSEKLTEDDIMRLRRMVWEINRDSHTISASERLSDNVYVYSREEDRTRII